ncbi:MAG: polysaccharide deacetylase family protein [Eubacteriales bacterium]|nr:polysaccharide deacetylase family protein [Eubacteriales bacterium]
MKRMGKVIFLTLLLVWICGSSALAAAVTKLPASDLENVTEAVSYAGKWQKDPEAGNFRFILEDGTYLTSTWLRVGKKIYYVDANGYRVKGTVKYRKRFYFLNKHGVLLTGKWSKRKYYFQEDGTRASGWTEINGNTYFFRKKTGEKCKGWTKIKGETYYFQKSGILTTSAWIKIDGKTYYVDSQGRQARSRWVKISGKKYYMDPNGVRVTGRYMIDGKGYYFNEDGVYDPSVSVGTIDPNKPMVALTFDDGPGPYTDRLLNCLEKNGGVATFFMVGSSVPSYKSTVRRMVKLGCELGNHSYDHPAFSGLSDASIQSQVSRTNNNIFSAAGQYPTVFRLPYGDGAHSSRVLSQLGLPSIFWSIDTRDWANKGNPQHTVNEVLNNVKSGDIVLMHDIHYSTVQAAETIIPALVKRGYQLVTVSDLAKYKGKTSLHKGTTYTGFR